MRAKQRTALSERSRRADRNFAVTTIALMTFFAAAAFGAWMFGNPSGAAVNAPIPPSQSDSLR
jgi:uncharacterized MAPEG superfamily protein